MRICHLILGLKGLNAERKNNKKDADQLCQSTSNSFTKRRVINSNKNVKRSFNPLSSGIK